MCEVSHLSFILERIPASCHVLMDMLITNQRLSNRLAAADRWLLESTASRFGEKKFVWAELLTDLAHSYPLPENDCLTLVPLFFHLPGPARRLLLSFVYVHREEIVPSVLVEFVLTLCDVAHVLRSSHWTTLLLGLLRGFCDSVRVDSDPKHSSQSHAEDAVKELPSSASPRLTVPGHCTGKSEDFCYKFSKENADSSSLLFATLKDGAQDCHTSIWGPFTSFVCNKLSENEAENRSNFRDTEMELSDSEFLDSFGIVPSQRVRTAYLTQLTQQPMDDDDHVMSPASIQLSPELQTLAESLKDACKKSETVSSIEPLLCLTPAELEAFCDAVGFDEMCESAVDAACRSLCGSSSPQFSHESSSIIARLVFLPQVESLQQSPSRLLISALTLFSQLYPRAMMTSLIVPVVTSGDSCTAFKADLLVKLIKAVFSSDQYSELLNRLLAQLGIWSENALDVIQHIVDKKPSVSDCDVKLLVTALCTDNATKHVSSLKFGKLALSVVLAYGGKMSGDQVELLQRLAEEHHSFMKKSLLSAVAKLRA